MVHLVLLHSFQELRAANNELTSLAIGGSDLPSLDELYVPGNRLTSLADATRFPNLDVLDVRKNALGTEDCLQPLRQLSLLTSLLLAGNGVVDVMGTECVLLWSLRLVCGAVFCGCACLPLSAKRWRGV